MLAMPRLLAAATCAAAVAACSGGPTQQVQGDISRVLDVKATFGGDFRVSTIGPTGIDPRLLVPQALPPGVRFDPAACAGFGAGLAVPAGVKGNMAAVTAEGSGNRFIAIAVETSEALTLPEPGADCRRVAYAGPGARGLVEVADTPVIDGAATQGTHRVVTTTVDGKPASGELYDYVARFGSFLVIVTANPLVVPNVAVRPVDTRRARDLLTAAVASVRGS